TSRPTPTNSSSFGASTSSSAAPKLRLGHEGLRTARAKFASTRAPPRVFTVESDLAERWQPDDLTYVFYLRNGVNWHNASASRRRSTSTPRRRCTARWG